MHVHVAAPHPGLQRFLLLSLLGHALALIIFTFTIGHTVRTSPPAAVQVRLVGVPIPSAPAKAKKPPEDVRTQDSAAPKEPPPEMKTMPPSEATTRMVQEEPLPTPTKEAPVNAQERPPVLDKNPEKKKVVKNREDAKVVKNPEDYLNNLDSFLDDNPNVTPTPDPKAMPSTQLAGEGPQLQLNLAEQGVVDGIRNHVMQNWNFMPGADLRGLAVTFQVNTQADGVVTQVVLRQSSGNRAFDASLERAIRKASPLPFPRDKAEAFQVLELTFGQP